MKLSRDQVGGLFILCFSFVYGYLIFDIPEIDSVSGFDARSMPTFLAALGIVFSVGLLCRRGESASISHLNLRQGLAFIFLLIAYGLGLRPAGVLASTLIFLLAGFWLLGERNIGKNLVVAGSASVGFWLIMSELLGVYLPPWPELLRV